LQKLAEFVEVLTKFAEVLAKVNGLAIIGLAKIKN
jgi:hypothetical protein